MNQNKLLKIYLVSAAASVIMFVTVFIVGVNCFGGMGAVYGATLPFLFAAFGFLTAFGLGLTPTREISCSANRSNVVYLKTEVETADSGLCCGLRRIS